MARRPSTIGYGSGVSSIQVTGLQETLDNIKAFKELVTLKVARTAGLIAIDLLSHAQPRVPVETGELRESGIAKIKLGRGRTLTIGTGNADGTVSADLGSIKSADLKHVRSVRSEVRYFKMKDDFDVAVYAHEQLAPYNGQHGTKDRPIAQTPGTGPKYLDIPWRQRKSIYLRAIKDALSGKELAHDLQQIKKIKQRRVGKFTVDVVELVHSQIDTYGYRRIHF